MAPLIKIHLKHIKQKKCDLIPPSTTLTSITNELISYLKYWLTRFMPGIAHVIN